jgi:MinD superfamily P-loop ATPase
MTQIVIISGKGGTGKTTIAASFAALASLKTIADTDVDAANLHLILNPKIKEEQEFRGAKVAVIEKEKCTGCGICEQNCRFDAITFATTNTNNELNLNLNPILCEGCGVCVALCPEAAIKLEEVVSGYAFISDTKYGEMSHARLNVAEEASGKLVTQVRNNAIQRAKKASIDLILIDGPPGIGCPVIASLSGVDIALIVTEPTQSGLHDLKRVLSVIEHFGVQAMVCINKYDINEEITAGIEVFCREKGGEIVGKIPFDEIVTKSIVAGVPVVEFCDGKVSKEIRKMWDHVLKK